MTKPGKGRKGSGATSYPRRGRAQRTKPKFKPISAAEIARKIKQRGIEQELTLLRLAFNSFVDEVRERLEMSPTAAFGPKDMDPFRTAEEE